MLGSHRVGPIVKHDWFWDSPINYCLGEGRIQPPPEQEDRSSGISFPLRDIPEVVEGRDVGI